MKSVGQLSRRIIRYVLGLSVTSLFVLAVSMYWLLATESGLQFIGKQAQESLPGLHIATIDGTVADGLSLSDVRYQAPDLQIKSKAIKFQITLSELLTGTVQIDSLYLEGVQLVLTPADDKTTPARDEVPLSLPDIELPLAIELNRIRVDDFALVHSGEPYQLDHFLFSAELTDRLVLKELQLDVPQQRQIPAIQLTASGTSELTRPHDALLNLNWSTSIDPVGKLKGELIVQGNSEKLVLKHHLQPFSAQLNVRLEQPMRALNWYADLVVPTLQWPLSSLQAQAKTRAQVKTKVGDSGEAGQKPQLAVTQLRIKGQGDMKSYQLKLNTRLETPPLPETDWQLTLKGNQRQVSIEQLVGHLFEGAINAKGMVYFQPTIQGHLELDSHGIKLTEFWPDWPSALSLQQKLLASFTDSTLRIEQFELNLLPTAAAMQIAGAVNLDLSGANNLTLDWQNLQWPLLNSAELTSRTGRLVIQGNADTYHLDLTGQVAGRQLPDIQMQVNANGNQQGLQQFDAVLASLGGKIAIEGQANWKPVVDWNVRVTGDGVNPGKRWSDWPGQLALRLDTRGTLTKELDATLDLYQLSGRLRDYPLLAKSQIAVAGSDYQIKQLQLLSGSTQIAGHGRFKADKHATDIAAQVTVSAPDVSTLLPQAKGKLNVQASVSGHPDTPHLAVNLKGTDLGFEQWSLGKLDGAIDLNVLKDRLVVDLNAKHMAQSGQTRLKTLSLNTQGKITEHKIHASLATLEEELALTLQGGYTHKVQAWSGWVEDIRLATELFGRWHLAENTSLYLDKKKLALGGAQSAACFEPDPSESHVTASLCTRLGWQPDKSILNLTLRDLPMEFVAAHWLPVGIAITGTEIDADVVASVADNQAIRSTATVRLSKGMVKTELDGEIKELHHDGGRIDLNIDKTGLTTQGEFALLTNSIITTEAALPGFNRIPVSEDQTIQATLDTRIEDFSLIPAFVPQIEKVKGAIDGRATANGKLAKPRINVALSVKDASLFVPGVGLSLEKISASLIADEQGRAKSTIDLVSGQGWLKITSHARYHSPENWQGQVQIDGQNLTAVDLPVVNAQVSPNLKLQIEPDGVSVSGSVVIPAAEITPDIVVGESDGGAAAVTASRDVVIVDTTSEAQRKEEEQLFNVDGKVAIALGNNINLSVVGFNSRIAGGIDLLLDPALALPNAFGEVQIVDGRFRKYNQDLVIDKGRVIFSGGPVDNPTLDIEAYRPIREIGSNNAGIDKVKKAGVHIRGRLSEPQLILFSEPSMDEKNILSYIVTGAPYIGDKRTELALGTYLRPNLFVSLAFDIFEAEKTFNLRYDFNDKLGVEGVAGDRESGIDFSYRLSR
ncbi:MAG: hypothetical protein CSA50_00125 [Gammaproteobacteria bacterium]|nr:MAG: hypothetical protein CSA50_00125 [Gammaproteobacteria bacterium]